MALLPRVRDLKFKDLANAAEIVGEVFRDIVSWMRQQPDVQVKSAFINTGEPATITFRFTPNTLKVVRATDSDGAQWAVEPVPEWKPVEGGAVVTDIGGLPSGQRFGVTFEATKGGT